MTEVNKNYDLEERTAIFGEEVIGFCRTISQDAITRPLISQIVRSSTSIGANYMEANSASSKKDFKNKIYICKKEAQETSHWLRMIERVVPKEKEIISKLKKEIQELILIFGKIIATIKKKELSI